ncbi:MAG TPA: hypothetical protein VFO97_10290 [Desertimonas sp.]|nr:hypothetical protein [Desertimonas sp.]
MQSTEAEVTEAGWSDEQVSGARSLVASGPFADEARTVALDEAVAVLERSDHFDERANAAIAQLAGPRFEPIEPMQVMGGGGTGFTVFDRLDLDRHTWRFAWPDNYFVPGNSTERWLGLLDCPPAQRYASGSGSGFPSSGDPLTGRVFSWAQPPRVGVSSGVTSGGVFVFFRPTAALSVVHLAPEIDWTFQSRYFVDWDWGRNQAISVQLGGALALTAWEWNPASSSWERATNGPAGAVVSSTRQMMSTTDSNVSGSASMPPFTVAGHINSGGFSVPALVQSGRLYAFGVHANSWWKASFLPDHPSRQPAEPPSGAVKCWTSMTADVPFIWL